MKTIKSYSMKHPVLASIFITFFFLLIIMIPDKRIFYVISGGSEFTQTAKYMCGFIHRLLGFGICLIFMIKIGHAKALKFGIDNGCKVITLIWPAIILTICNMPYDLILEGTYHMDTSLLLPMILRYTGTGLIEEIFFRGVILSILLTAWCSSKKGIYKAVIASSIFFGLVHLINLVQILKGADILVETVSQIFYATFLGIFFAAIYLRTKNIWISVLFHSLFDIANGLYEITLKVGKVASTTITAAPTSISDGILNAAIMLPLALFGLFILRKVNWENVERSEIN